MFDKIKNIKINHIIYVALLAVLGLSFLAFSTSATVLTVIIGVLLIAFGGLAIVFSVTNPKKDRTFVIRLVFSSIIAACGILVTVINDKAFTPLIFCICLVVVVDGAFKFSLALSCRKHEVWGWWIVGILSLSIIISAFALSSFTPCSTTASSVWLGINLFALVAENVISTVWEAKCETAKKAELYYEVYRDIKDSEIK